MGLDENDPGAKRRYSAFTQALANLGWTDGRNVRIVFYRMCAIRLENGATDIVIPSGEAVAFLKDFDPYWATEYRGSDGHPGEITQSKLAALLRYYEILPEKGTRGDQSRAGYPEVRGAERSNPRLER